MHQNSWILFYFFTSSSFMDVTDLRSLQLFLYKNKNKKIKKCGIWFPVTKLALTLSIYREKNSSFLFLLFSFFFA